MRIEFSYDPPTDPPVILHLDDRLIVVDKPAGLLSVPGKLEGRADCLITRLQAIYPEALVVHRLDCDTSGLILFARDKAAQGHLGQEFEQRRAKKSYLARVKGLVEADSGTVDLPLSVDWPNRPRQMVNHQDGKQARTDWQVISRGGDETRIRLFPLTGRSHQLRVHMLAIGHPILGDQIYAPETLADHARLMLHAETLGLHHPATGDWVQFAAPCPF